MKALIVDDQSYVADGIYAGVNWEKLGIDKVYVAYSGSQAMQYIKNNQIDLVITDIEMPVISGVELAAWIVDYRPETAVIFLTAHADFSYAQQAVRLGCYDYIVQPVEYRKLELSIARVKAELEKKNSREDLYDDGLKWNSMKKEMQESFWNKVLLQKTSYESDPDRAGKSEDRSGAGLAGEILSDSGTGSESERVFEQLEPDFSYG